MHKVVASLLLAFTMLCGHGNAQTPVVAADQPLSHIALGSCNREDLPQPLWRLISRHQPELWIWLGDNIYGDTDDMRVMRAKYRQQLDHPSYREFIRKVPVIGTWDDHDYGRNNGGREYRARAASQQALLDFLGEPENSARRRQAGVYTSYTYGPAGQQVKVMLLDTRYHRDPIGSHGTILGEEQWRWLERELRDSNAQIHLIASGIQILPEQHRFEKWADFPAERARLLQLIADTKAPGVILLSGDRHIAELSRLDENAAGYPIYDLTTSGLTHSYRNAPHEPNRYRTGEFVRDLNWATIDIDWSVADPVITLRVRDERDRVRIEEKVRLSLLAR